VKERGEGRKEGDQKRISSPRRGEEDKERRRTDTGMVPHLRLFRVSKAGQLSGKFILESVAEEELLDVRSGKSSALTSLS
jgi:hypothetical protein